MTTQKAFANYQEVIDFHTESGTSSVIGIHTPCSERPQRMLRGFWLQFRKFKYLGCDLSVVPAQQLPADPLQVSYAAGEPTSDPRDILNPIMFKGCHGNDMGSILNMFYNGLPDSTLDESTVPSIVDRSGVSDSAEVSDVNFSYAGNKFIEALYYRALTDNTWSKAHPLRGFRKRGLHPRVYALASNVQLNPVDAGASTAIFPPQADLGNDSANFVNNGTVGYGGTYITPDDQRNNLVTGLPPTPPRFNTSTRTLDSRYDGGAVSFFTPRTVPLGWMDTRQRVGVRKLATTQALDGSDAHDNAIMAQAFESLSSVPTLVPKVFMGMILLSPSYKTEMYYRLVLNHHFAFAGFRGVSEMTEEDDINDYGPYTNIGSS